MSCLTTRTLASSTPSPYGGSAKIEFNAPAISPLIVSTLVSYMSMLRSRVQYLCSAAGHTYFETRPRASLDRCLASDKTPSGPLGSGSYKSEGERTSSSRASISILRNAYSDIFAMLYVSEIGVSGCVAMTFKLGEVLCGGSGYVWGNGDESSCHC
jgi:hypothetical protein